MLSGSNNCLQEVIEIIERNLDKVQQLKLLRGLNINWQDKDDLMFSYKLENIPWNRIKRQLELLGRSDVVNLIRNNTLITKGINSVRRKHFYQNTLINVIEVKGQI